MITTTKGRATSLRNLARELGLSVATVSEALRNSPRVTLQTRERVQDFARRSGYVPNPLVTAAMKAIRQSSKKRYRGCIGLLDVPEGVGLELHPFHREILAGAEAAAAQLGFGTELFWIGDTRPGCLSLARLNQVLEARGIDALVVLPFTEARDLSALDLSDRSAVQMDFCVRSPALHRVLPDHFSSLWNALSELALRGYERPGLVLNPAKDRRIQNRWTASFEAYWHARGLRPPVPLLLQERLERPVLLDWYEEHRPDVVLGHDENICACLENVGLVIPRDVGFFSLNILGAKRPLSGLDLNPRLMGRIVVSLLVALREQRLHGTKGPVQTMALEGTWTEGQTVRAARSLDTGAEAVSERLVTKL